MLNESYFDDFPEQETQRLILKKQSLEDVNMVYTIRSNPSVMRYMDAYCHQTPDVSRQFVEDNLLTYQKKEGLFWMIVNKQTTQIMGDFAFWKILKRHHRAEIGYTLLPKYWNQGYMTEVMRTLLKFGFDQLNLHSFEANVNPANTNSKHLLHRMGFREEGYFKENYYFDGKYLDSQIFSLLKTDFKYG